MKYFLTLTLTIFFFSCNEKNTQEDDNIEGLWLVKKVNVDNKDLTPIAKWVRFNADGSQASGNGWLQHSVGIYNLNIENQLTVTNTFGIKDDAESFKVNIDKNNMTWQRKENDLDIIISLEKTDKLPTSEANKLFGLWKFDSIIKDGKEVSESLNPSKKAMLFLRWDNTYELRNYPLGEKYGMFKTHSHKAQIDMVSYAKESIFQFYTFSLVNDKLLLKATNNDTEIKLTRIHQFLQ
ncbi:hypothetical protein KO506_11400 [Polaribacter vadi]|uniref:hypothetical protein n=1 Tax=Polaribacter TaxID=52959 RepID=UPI001C0A647B|nr:MULTISPECIES: hypothetical protein [Polaribacter]MBU3012010.1 hypothetical protein [Polaribacter vadi]MDO6741825.1 hypothetical protein [Polaribacter sp. 1_MG-2023]